MACEHKRLRCTDGVYYCLDCEARVEAPTAKAAAAEAAAKRPKCKAKKEAGK